MVNIQVIVYSTPIMSTTNSVTIVGTCTANPFPLTVSSNNVVFASFTQNCSLNTVTLNGGIPTIQISIGGNPYATSLVCTYPVASCPTFNQPVHSYLIPLPAIISTNYNPLAALGLGILGAIFYFKEGARMGATKMSRRMIAIIILATAGLLFLLSQNLLIIGLVAVGGYLYYKSGEE